MDVTATDFATLEAAIDQWIRGIGEAVDVLGVVVIALGIVWSTGILFQKIPWEKRYDHYRVQIGRSLLLGLEILVAADIIRTVALQLSFGGLGILAGLVLIRTFLNWTLASEIERIMPTDGPGKTLG